MHQHKTLNPRSQFPSSAELKDNTSQHSSQTDLSDVGLCSLNVHEFTYNSMICLLCMKQYKQALERLDFLIDTIPKKYAQQLWLIRGHLNSLLASSENNKNAYST